MQHIGRYQILQEIGRGAMGVVYRAMDPSIGRTVAIKTFRVSEIPENERARLRDRILREAQSAGVLSHPNIITIYDVAHEGDLAYIAMEFVDGPTLDRLFHTQELAPKQILDILHQTATALDYAHKQGIVHRDIKPANIMLREGATVKIADFGVAKIQSQQATLSGTIIGTPNYMSPEQIQGHEVDGRADQFSLAVIAYELLTGEKPFSAESMPTLLFKIVREDPVPPQRLNPTLGWPVETVLRRAMAKSPSDRYQNCSDFIRALENACASSKGWKPLPPGQSHDLPTVMERPAEAAAAVAAVEAADHEEEEDDNEPVPLILRIARGLAMVLVAGALLSLVLVGGYHYFGEPSEPEPTPIPATQADEGPGKAKPSSMPPAASQGSSQQAGGTQATKPPQRSELPNPDAPEQAAKEEPKQTPTKPVQTQPAHDTNGSASARLVTYPPGASIIVDNRPDLTCTSPCGFTLPPGRHTLSATLDGHRPLLKIFELPGESELYMRMESTTGTLVLRSDPPGAAIMIDGQNRPERTPITLTLPTGAHHVELMKEGFKTYTEDLEVKDSTITRIDVNWNAKRGSL